MDLVTPTLSSNIISLCTLIDYVWIEMRRDEPIELKVTFYVILIFIKLWLFRPYLVIKGISMWKIHASASAVPNRGSLLN